MTFFWRGWGREAGCLGWREGERPLAGAVSPTSILDKSTHVFRGTDTTQKTLQTALCSRDVLLRGFVALF